MNETKQVWKDVAAILKESGWPESNKEEEAALKADEKAILFPSLPSRKEPAYISWLPAVAVTALVTCLLAFFFSVDSRQQKLNEQHLTVLREQMEKIQQQLKVLKDDVDSLRRNPNEEDQADFRHGTPATGTTQQKPK